MSVFLLVSYDVSDERRRSCVASELENFGRRVQRSVFECQLAEPEINQLHRKLGALIDPVPDQLRFYRLCQKDRKSILIDGLGTPSRNPDYHLI